MFTRSKTKCLRLVIDPHHCLSHVRMFNIAPVKQSWPIFLCLQEFKGLSWRSCYLRIRIPMWQSQKNKTSYKRILCVLEDEPNALILFNSSLWQCKLQGFAPALPKKATTNHQLIKYFPLILSSHWLSYKWQNMADTFFTFPEKRGVCFMSFLWKTQEW